MGEENRHWQCFAQRDFLYFVGCYIWLAFRATGAAKCRCPYKAGSCLLNRPCTLVWPDFTGRAFATTGYWPDLQALALGSNADSGGSMDTANGRFPLVHADSGGFRRNGHQFGGVIPKPFYREWNPVVARAKHTWSLDGHSHSSCGVAFLPFYKLDGPALFDRNSVSVCIRGWPQLFAYWVGVWCLGPRRMGLHLFFSKATRLFCKGLCEAYPHLMVTPSSGFLVNRFVFPRCAGEPAIDPKPNSAEGLGG